MEKFPETAMSLEWLLDIFRSIDVGVVIVERDYKIKLWNSFMVNHSGISSPEVMNSNLFEAFPELPETWLQQKIDSVFLMNIRSFITWEQRPYVFKFKNYRPITGAATHMYQNVTLIPLHSNRGEVSHVGLVVYDVTDIAISQEKLESANKLLAKLSRIDGLTQLFNRGFWEESLRLEFERCRRSNQPCSMVMFDIDHFKKINDGYGHQAGDAVIRNTAYVLKNTIRQTDIAGRYGGEEFAVILGGIDVNTAHYFAERLRKRIETQAVVYEGTEIHYTVSLGIAQLDASMDNYQQLIEAADAALYESKRGGRNRASLFTAEA